MNAILKVWKSLTGFAEALDRLTGLAHQTADVIETRVEAIPQTGNEKNGRERLGRVNSKA